MFPYLNIPTIACMLALLSSCFPQDPYDGYDCSYTHETFTNNAFEYISNLELSGYRCNGIFSNDNYRRLNIEQFEFKPKYKTAVLAAHDEAGNSWATVNSIAEHCLGEINREIMITGFEFITINDFNDHILAGDPITQLVQIRIAGDCPSNAQYASVDEYFGSGPYDYRDLEEFYSLTQKPTVTDTLTIKMILAIPSRLINYIDTVASQNLSVIIE